MSRIIVIGGHGKVALLATEMLTARGDEVVSVVRNPDHLADVESRGAEGVVADIEHLDADGFADLLSGADAIVWAAGAGGGDEARTYAVDRDAAIASIDAAERAGVARYVMVSYFGSSPDHGIDPSNSFFAYAEAKAAADEHLRGSNLDWTIVAPSSLTLDPPTGRIDVDADSSESVSRADVAHVIAAVLHDPSTVRRTIAFNSGDTPIEQAVAG